VEKASNTCWLFISAAEYPIACGNPSGQTLGTSTYKGEPL
jgi:hypothetical protein